MDKGKWIWEGLGEELEMVKTWSEILKDLIGYVKLLFIRLRNFFYIHSLIRSFEIVCVECYWTDCLLVLRWLNHFNCYMLMNYDTRFSYIDVITYLKNEVNFAILNWVLNMFISLSVFMDKIDLFLHLPVAIFIYFEYHGYIRFMKWWCPFFSCSLRELDCEQNNLFF